MEDGLEAAPGIRQGRRARYVRTADGESEARLVALSCSDPPEGRAQWSLRLLADRAVELGYIDTVSYETVRPAFPALSCGIANGAPTIRRRKGGADQVARPPYLCSRKENPTKTTRLAPLPAVLAGLLACQAPPTPTPASPESLGDDLAVFMGTREERAARAPYSPPGWPLKVGDLKPPHRLGTLNFGHPDFADWNGIEDVFWVDTIAFGAYWLLEWPESWTTPDKWPVRYLGHRPMKTKYLPDGLVGDDPYPPHLEGRDPKDLRRWLSGPPHKEPPEFWTRERWLAGKIGPGEHQ